ncbi:MAG: hypothetical protein AAB680_03080 [Pseudomonadota bacterium]
MAKRLFNKLLIAIVGFSTFGLAEQAWAIEPEQVSIRAGTLGAGVEVGLEVMPTLVLRGVYNNFDYDYKKNVDGIAYDGTLALGSYGAQVDFHPPAIPFYITAGMYKNDNNINLNARQQGSYNIGGNTYSAAQIGTLNSRVSYGPTALYGGLGMELAAGPAALVLEGGLYLQNDPNIRMSASGPIGTNPAFLADLNNEIAAQRDTFDKTKYWPAITVMARWKF